MIKQVPYHIDGGQPSYIIIAGLVFTPLSEPLIEYVLLSFASMQKKIEILLFRKCLIVFFWGYEQGGMRGQHRRKLTLINFVLG